MEIKQILFFLIFFSIYFFFGSQTSQFYNNNELKIKLNEAGFIYQPDAMWRKNGLGDTLNNAMQLFGVEIFYETPLNNEKGKRKYRNDLWIIPTFRLWNKLSERIGLN